MGLALWLVPSAASQPTLRSEMDRLRSANKDAPFFEPHATLLAGLPKELEPDQIIQTAKSALQDCAPIVCALDDVTTRGFYFQCILIALEQQPKLIALNQALRRAFHLTEQPPYFPHVSLLYANIDADESKRQISRMESDGIFKRNKSQQGISFAGLDSIDFVSIDLYDCNGRPDEWKMLHSISLSDA